MSPLLMADPVEQAMQQYEQQGCVHEQFVRQAQATPEAVAVVTHDGNKVLILRFQSNCQGHFYWHEEHCCVGHIIPDSYLGSKGFESWLCCELF
jgi:non-ribosomal peptide synthetase component F